MLDQAGFKDALKDVFESMPGSAPDAAAALTTAYADYASGGTFNASTPTISSVQIEPMKGTLATALVLPGSVATFAAAWASAVAAFWIGVPIVGTQSGATLACPGAASLTDALTSAFSTFPDTAAAAADSLATALHTATATVTGTVAPPPGTPVVIA